MPETYPLTVVTVTIPSYEDHGSVYVLTLPDGSTVELGDGDNDYWALAAIIDRAFPTPEDEGWREATPAESEAWHAGWRPADGMEIRETDHGLEVRQHGKGASEAVDTERRDPLTAQEWADYEAGR